MSARWVRSSFLVLGWVRGAARLIAVVVLFVAMALPAQAQQTPSQAQQTHELSDQAARAAEAATLFEQGRVAFEQNDLQQALELLSRAHELAPDHRNAAVLGQLELELGQHVAAATHLEESVRLFPRGTDSKGLTRVMDGLSEARRHVCMLRVQSSTPKAELFIDGKHTASLPLDRDLFVEPGTHTIEVRAEGYQAQQEKVHLPEGGTQDLTLTLKPLDAGAPLAESSRKGSTASRVALITGSTLCLAALGTGIGLELWARGADDEATKLREGAGNCSGAGAAQCASVLQQSDTAASRHELAAVAFISAGVVGVATISVYALLSGDAGPEGVEAISVKPLLGPTSAGLGLEGGFW